MVTQDRIVQNHTIVLDVVEHMTQGPVKNQETPQSLAPYAMVTILQISKAAQYIRI
jgi:hypothetical protein